MLAGEQRVQRPASATTVRDEFPLFPQEPDLAIRNRDWPTLRRWLSGTSGCPDIPLNDAPLMRAYIRRIWQRERKSALPRLWAHVRHPLTLLQRAGRAMTVAQPALQDQSDVEADLVGWSRA